MNGGYRVWQETHNYRAFSVFAQMLKPLPDDLPLIVGDALHNLRDCLDHLIFAISRKNPTLTAADEESVSFPIWDWAVKLDAQPIRFLNWPATAEVCYLAPEPTHLPNSEHPLWLLNKMNNRDKHREVAFKPAARASHSLGIGNARIERMAVYGNQPLQTGTRVTLLEFEGDQLQAQITHFVHIAFDKGVEVEDREVIGTLRWFHDHIRDTVFASLEPYL